MPAALGPRDSCKNGTRRPAGAVQRARAALLFRALSDPTRLEVLALIASRDEPICVCDIVGRFEVSQPTISHHLRVLRKAQLVQAERRGTWAYYSVHHKAAGVMETAVGSVLSASESARG